MTPEYSNVLTDDEYLCSLASVREERGSEAESCNVSFPNSQLWTSPHAVKWSKAELGTSTKAGEKLILIHQFNPWINFIPTLVFANG